MGIFITWAMADNTSMTDVLSTARYGRLQQHVRQVAALCDVARDGRCKELDSRETNTSATAHEECFFEPPPAHDTDDTERVL